MLTSDFIADASATTALFSKTIVHTGTSVTIVFTHKCIFFFTFFTIMYIILYSQKIFNIGQEGESTDR